jgi:hypothetical protein
MAVQAIGVLRRAASAMLYPFHRRSPLGLAYEVFVERDVEVRLRRALGDEVTALARELALSRQSVHASLQRTAAVLARLGRSA